MISERLDLQTLVREGSSFSGRERHCCFLNTGGPRFADISSISNLDIPDDRRAIAATDWDHDGDLDLWIANRNGPQLRLLRNEIPTNHHFLSIQLVGKTCNRDAIGARVVLVMQGDESHPRLRTLRAGEGYLSQSSKWLHFGLGTGLGTAAQIERIDVQWPGGTIESFRGLEPDSAYRLTQGSGTAELLPRGERPINFESKQQVTADESPPRVLLASHVPLPRMEYTDSVGQVQSLPLAAERPVLVNLWASWCAPCLLELRDFASRHGELQTAGLDILALSVDHLSAPRDDRDVAVEGFDKFAFPFAVGQASTGLLDKLQIVDQQLFDRHTALPIPCSFLVSKSGQLAAIYRGPVTVDRLLNDVAKLTLDEEQLRGASLPFPGRWISGSARISLVPLFYALRAQGYPEDAMDLLTRFADRFPDDWRDSVRAAVDKRSPK